MQWKINDQSRWDAKGIGGWLLFFCVSVTILSPLRAIYNLGSELLYFWDEIQSSNFLQEVFYAELISGLIVIVFGMYVGIRLWRVNVNGITYREVQRIVKWLFALLIIVPTVSQGRFLSLFEENNLEYIVTWEIIVGNIIFSVVWYLYFSRSIRVINTYPDDKYAKKSINGNWQIDKENGPSAYYRKDNSTYIGEMKNGLPHGYGFYNHHNGDKFEGEFKNGRIEGYGTYEWNNGSKYFGYWLNNERNGSGTNIDKNGDKCTGNFIKDAMHGFGRCKYQDGSEYIGEWQFDKRHGKGKLINADRTVVEGIWDLDKLQPKK